MLASGWVAFLLGLILVLSFIARALPDERSSPCPTFTAHEIDIAYKAWDSSLAYQTKEITNSCMDDPGLPAIWLESDAMETSNSRFIVFVQGTVAGCSFKIRGETMGCVTERSESLDHDVDGKACRREILESQPWQALCDDVSDDD